ncbi:MAG TPA: hypothetical protein VFN61_04440 [Acidimicrobiales bacterium]|nr:hypothetical protein [Acidimicrobiales bacterium]
MVSCAHEHVLIAFDAYTLFRHDEARNASLVIDLNEVQFLGASTLGVLVKARDLLQQASRS